MGDYYVMGDIHGCYSEFLSMLKKIDYNKGSDVLILIGDYIDRGLNSYEILKWIEGNIKYRHVIMLQGNHEAEFVMNVDILSNIDDRHSLSYIYDKIKDKSVYFDIYGTIGDLIKNKNATIQDLKIWADMFRKMPLQFRLSVFGKHYYCVHAGLPEYIDDISRKKDSEKFLLYARDEAYQKGGWPNYTIIAGHTPTIDKDALVYNNGDVFYYYNEAINCRYYDIDCGCVFRKEDINGKLACIRLYDEAIYYV